MYLVFITLLGLLLRLILANQSFWLDEGASLLFAQMSLPQMLQAMQTDFHPPLFYALLQSWLPLAGSQEWVIRLPFILIGALSVPAVFYLSLELFGKKSLVPTVAAFLLAINPLHIYYSQDLRMYSLATLLVVLSWQFLLQKKYILFSLVTALSLYTFYGVVLNIFAQLVFLSLARKWDKKFFLAFAVSGISFLPWLSTFFIQLENGSYLKNVLPGWQILSGSLTIKSLLLIPLKFIMGRISLEPQLTYYLIGGLFMFIFSICILYSRKNKSSTPMWIACFLPVLLGSIISLKTPMLGYWRFLFILPFFLILVTAGIEKMPHKISRAVFVFISLSTVAFNVYFWTQPQFQRENWRGFAQYVHRINPVVIVAFPQSFAPLRYYAPNLKVITAHDSRYQIVPDLHTKIQEALLESSTVVVMEYLADITDRDRKVLKIVKETNLRPIAIYNFNNLGQVHEFQK